MGLHCGPHTEASNSLRSALTPLQFEKCWAASDHVVTELTYRMTSTRSNAYYIEISSHVCSIAISVFVLKIKLYVIWDTLIHYTLFHVIKIDGFRGDLTGTLAKTKTMTAIFMISDARLGMQLTKLLLLCTT